LDRLLPRFSTQRYVVIWLAGMVPLVFLLLVLTQCNGQGSSQGSNQTAGGCTAEGLGTGKFLTIDTAKGCIVAKLHTQADAGVGQTIANFEGKANKGEFDGRTFHRVEDWVIQGGDPLGNGTGGGDMPSEYNQLPFNAGALGVARGPDPKINNDSQFFITKSDAPHLNGQYTNWGQVSKGMEVVNQIAVGDKMIRVRVENR
jgi:peptidyl-prolyl cis-trans isomerase B (cyclophilin B)